MFSSSSTLDLYLISSSVQSFDLLPVFEVVRLFQDTTKNGQHGQVPGGNRRICFCIVHGLWCPSTLSLRCTLPVTLNNMMILKSPVCVSAMMREVLKIHTSTGGAVLVHVNAPFIQ